MPDNASAVDREQDPGGRSAQGGSGRGDVDRAPWNVGAATGIGSLPGTSADEAARWVAGELPDLPYLAELPGRGVGADMIGRAVGLLVDIFGEVVPSGWRISRRPGRDTRRAKDFLAWDLDAAENHYAGAQRVKIQVCGPWTLAAGIEMPSGNRAVGDSGAVNDLVDSLIEGINGQIADVRRRIPGAKVLVQVDEPGLPAVLAGSLATASGFGTVRQVEPVEVERVLDRLTSALSGDALLAHCCHRKAPLDLLQSAGFEALSVNVIDLGSSAARLDPIGEAVEAGAVLMAGLVPGTDPSGGRRELRDWAAPLLDTWNRLALPRSSLAAVVPTPTCGLAGASTAWAVRAMALCRELAEAFQDLPEGW